MNDTPETLKKKIENIKVQLGREGSAGKDLKKDPVCRQLRKELKRTQRKLALMTPRTLDQQMARVAALTELISKRLSDLTQGAKKVQANPYVHSMRKKTKSLNKRKRKLDRVAKTKTAGAPAPAAAAAPAPTPEPK